MQLQEESLLCEIAENKQKLVESKLSAKECKNLIFGTLLGIGGTIIAQLLWEFIPKLFELIFQNTNRKT